MTKEDAYALDLAFREQAEAYTRKVQHVQPVMRAAMRGAYMMASNDLLAVIRAAGFDIIRTAAEGGATSSPQPEAAND